MKTLSTYNSFITKDTRNDVVSNESHNTGDDYSKYDAFVEHIIVDLDTGELILSGGETANIYTDFSADGYGELWKKPDGRYAIVLVPGLEETPKIGATEHFGIYAIFNVEDGGVWTLEKAVPVKDIKREISDIGAENIDVYVYFSPRELTSESIVPPRATMITEDDDESEGLTDEYDVPTATVSVVQGAHIKSGRIAGTSLNIYKLWKDKAAEIWKNDEDQYMIVLLPTNTSDHEVGDEMSFELEFMFTPAPIGEWKLEKIVKVPDLPEETKELNMSEYGVCMYTSK